MAKPPSPSPASDAPLPRGRYVVDAFESIPEGWVQFDTAAHYPFRLRREWRAAGDLETVHILARYIAALHVTDAEGKLVAELRWPPIAAPSESDPEGLANRVHLLEDLDSSTVVALIRAFSIWIQVDVASPPKV